MADGSKKCCRSSAPSIATRQQQHIRHMLPAFVPPPPPYPYLTAVRAFAPPDDLRIESLGRPPTCFGPRSYKPTPKDRIDATERNFIKPSASASAVKLESIPARETEWREGFIRRKATYMNGTPFDIKVGRGDKVHVPFTMQRGLPTGRSLYRTPTRRLHGFAPPTTPPFGGSFRSLSRSSTTPQLILDPIGTMSSRGITPISPPRYRL